MALDAITCIVAIVVMGYGTWWVVKWFFKIGTNQARKNESLTPADLRVLEETTKRLMDDLRAVTDECVARIENACQQAEHRISQAPKTPVPSKIEVTNMADMAPAAPYIADAETHNLSDADNTDLPSTPRTEYTVASFAKSTGLTTGEVELMRGLREYGKSKKAD